VIKIEKSSSERICQGDIFKDIEYIEYAIEKDGIFEISKILFPLVVVLTQDCDLQQDYSFRFSDPTKPTQDKYLLSVLVVPLYNIEHFYDGEHLLDIGRVMEKSNRKPTATMNKKLKQNEIPRYHYLEFPDDSDIVTAVIDFKQYFSLDVSYLISIKDSNFVCKIQELYREDISHRFAYFLSRIGLPDMDSFE